ncbi:hypothetical protein ACFYPK_33390, partial [Streptomyces halstedii]|uniref:hypothetical protein n=1 Tax=Streptomyces halstedii TaxID=1944 RepID=UPI0036C85BEB
MRVEQAGAEVVRRCVGQWSRTPDAVRAALLDGSAAPSGDRFSHAAWRACVVMTVSYSTGVSR